MDKYEYNVKLEQIKKLIRKKDYATAARIADTIDWYKVKNNQTIVMIADVYEASGRYEQSKENLKLAYDRSGLGRQIAYKLVKICIKCGDLEEAEEFYDDFVSAAPRDISKYLLQYELAKAKGDPIETQISILEQYLEEDMDDRWAFELAKLYHKSGQRDKCIEQCDTVMLWFSDGKYVDKAMDLKMIYTPLTKSQQERYEARWREKSAQNNIKIEEIKVKEVDVANKYNTQNIQNALKESMEEIFSKEGRKQSDEDSVFKPLKSQEKNMEAEPSLENIETYDEAEEIISRADDYILRMEESVRGDGSSADNEIQGAGRRNVNGMEMAAEEEFEEEIEEGQDENLGDTKIFLTTRSRKNLGDTKIFDPRSLMIAEQVSFEEPEKGMLDEEKQEAYILEEKTIKNEPIEDIAEAVPEELEEETVEEVLEEPEEETIEEVLEEPEEETVEEVFEEPEEETVEEVLEEPEEETVEEVLEEPEEEIVEEVFEEPEEETVEEVFEEPEEETVEEVFEEPEVEVLDQQETVQPEAAEEAAVALEEVLPEQEAAAEEEQMPGEEEQIERQMSIEDFFNDGADYFIPEEEEEIEEPEITSQEIEMESEMESEMEEETEEPEIESEEPEEEIEEPEIESWEPEIETEPEEEIEEPEIESVEPEIETEPEEEIETEPEKEPEGPEIEPDQGEIQEEEEIRDEIDPFETVTNLRIDKSKIKRNEEEEADEEEKTLTNEDIKGIIKDFIGKYSGVQGLDKQMLKTLQNVIVEDNCNIFIMGDAKSGKTSLGIDIIKVVNKIKRNNNRRIAKISGEKLIGKELSLYFSRLRGSDLFIENIGLMDDSTVAELLQAMDNDPDHRIVVIEDEKVSAEKFLEKHSEINDYFASRIIVKQNKIKDWVEVAKDYAEEKGYEIDEMGLLALHAKIDELYGVTLVIQRNHVESIIDHAINKIEKGGFFKRLFGKKKVKVLTEEHFN